MTESEIQKDIIQYLKSIDCMVFRMNSGYIRKNVKLSPPGTPDLLVITKSGIVIWIEVKTETGQLNAKQEIMHLKLLKHKQIVFVCRSVDDIKEKLNGK